MREAHEQHKRTNTKTKVKNRRSMWKATEKRGESIRQAQETYRRAEEKRKKSIIKIIKKHIKA